MISNTVEREARSITENEGYCVRRVIGVNTMPFAPCDAGPFHAECAAMAYDEKLVERIRVLLKGRRGITEKKMFGGIAILLNGKMCCGVLKDDLVARVGTDGYATALAKPHVRPMDFTGRPMKGYVYVAPAAIRDKRSLKRWVDACLAHAATL